MSLAGSQRLPFLSVPFQKLSSSSHIVFDIFTCGIVSWHFSLIQSDFPSSFLASAFLSLIAGERVKALADEWALH